MTLAELRNILEEGGFKKTYYSLDGRSASDGLHLHPTTGPQWAIDYFERGTRRTLGTYDSEDEACRALYRLLSSDPTSR